MFKYSKLRCIQVNFRVDLVFVTDPENPIPPGVNVSSDRKEVTCNVGYNCGRCDAVGGTIILEADGKPFSLKEQTRTLWVVYDSTADIAWFDCLTVWSDSRTVLEHAPNTPSDVVNKSDNFPRHFVQ